MDATKWKNERMVSETLEVSCLTLIALGDTLHGVCPRAGFPGMLSSAASFVIDAGSALWAVHHDAGGSVVLCSVQAP